MACRQANPWVLDPPIDTKKNAITYTSVDVILKKMINDSALAYIIYMACGGGASCESLFSSSVEDTHKIPYLSSGKTPIIPDHRKADRK
ncbi:hypothetical protein MRB53_011776 [Persea americana]|uniref:Uncharacterized protein n=1 Tax=Persea americana TaxID=3435 RepID=A0ACC2LVS8_PERAE|nr:hypothetical protein MRB53_011776 [Persea americana]